MLKHCTLLRFQKPLFPAPPKNSPIIHQLSILSTKKIKKKNFISFLISFFYIPSIS